MLLTGGSPMVYHGLILPLANPHLPVVVMVKCGKVDEFVGKLVMIMMFMIVETRMPAVNVFS